MGCAPRNKIVLYPGDFAFAGNGTRIHTLLGSCIAITLWHARLQVGGMCHFMLPRRPGRRCATADLDGRYADEAMELFRWAALKAKTPLREYRAKIFGGGNVTQAPGQCVDDSIGTHNVNAAMQLLAQEKIEILVAHVGEFGHRRIVFDAGTGDVWVRHGPGAGQGPAVRA